MALKEEDKPKSDEAPKLEAPADPAAEEGGVVAFDYIKGNLFRVVHADGVIGGVSPDGSLIHMGIWNERYPIPQRLEFPRVGEGLGRVPVGVTQRQAIVRELEVHVILSPGLALDLIAWLQRQLTKIAGREDEHEGGEGNDRQPGERD